ncbi:MAG: RNA polymerase sigma factor [Flammeovirgaceae bacterium]
MSLSTYTDNQLTEIFNTTEKKDEVFTEIMHRYQERIYWLIRKMVLTHEDADDLTQDVFVKVYHKLNEFKGNAQLYTWLYRIAVNHTLTFIEREKRKIYFEDNEMLEQMLSEKIEQEMDNDAEEMDKLLQLAISNLPEKQRIVFLMRYYDEMEYKQISEILGTSEGSLKASYHHAVKKIEEFVKARIAK